MIAKRLNSCGWSGRSGERSRPAAGAPVKTGWRGYPNCLKLTNRSSEVILAPEAGGRVLVFSREGRNILYQDRSVDGLTWQEGGKSFHADGGRFDVGPAWLIPPHLNLWLGPWSGTVTGPRSARLVSLYDPATGLQLIRDFELDASESRLIIRQTMLNRSDRTIRWCYWGRTLADGAGCCVVPLNPESRFPRGFCMYGPGPYRLDYRPEGLRNIEVRDGFLIFTGGPEIPQYGFDTRAGWLAFLNHGLLFVTRFPVYPERVYNEAGGFSAEVYYFQDRFCELEPVGPQEVLAPGASARFTEEWWLFACPPPGPAFDPVELAGFVERNTEKVC